MTIAVGRTVHYAAYGTPGGEYPSVCRMALVTEIRGGSGNLVGLCVVNPTGVFFRSLADGGAVQHLEHSEQDAPGARCNRGDRAYPGGTWHVPEIV